MQFRSISMAKLVAMMPYFGNLMIVSGVIFASHAYRVLYNEWFAMASGSLSFTAVDPDSRPDSILLPLALVFGGLAMRDLASWLRRRLTPCPSPVR